MNERMKFNPAEAAAAGEADARLLASSILAAEDGDNPGKLMSDALAGIIGLAADNRLEECSARLDAFCNLIGLLLRQSAKFALSRASVIELQLAVRALESNFTESEGGEL